MDKWQINAAKKMTDFLQDVFKVEKVEVYGSVLDWELLDVFSDVDMNVFLQKDVEFNSQEFINVASEKFGILGYQVHKHEGRDLFRLCFENGWRFDISFFYQKVKECPMAESFECSVDSLVKDFWFCASMVLTKLGRGDYLIASHLALGLCQQIIVLQMIVRDYKKGTHIHRFGDKENVPVFDGLFSATCEGDAKSKILNMLFVAAEQMDKAAMELSERYTCKTHKLKAIQVIGE